MYPLKKLIFLLPFFMYLYIKPLFYTPSLTMIDVGQGDSFLLQKSFYNILIDTGGKFSYVNEKKDFYKGKEIILYLKSRGIRKLHVLFLSHGDKDHMGDALYLVKHFPIKKVILNSGNDNKDEKKLLKYLKKEKIAYRKMSRGEEKVGSIKFYMLNKKNTENENEDSLILYTKIEKNNILFMGDAGVTSEKELLNAYKLPKMDILKIGHHGSITSSNFTFLKRVKPTYSLISVGKNNKYGHPHEEILNNLHKIKSHVYLTSKHGMVRISLKKQIAIESLMH